VKFTKRLKNAWKMIFNKSDRETVELNNLYKFLGIDPDEDERAISEATYFACMKVLSEAIGKLPLKLLRYNERNGVETARKHPLYYALHDRPNPYMTATNFWSTVEYSRNHYGNAYVWIQGAGKDMKLWILPSTQVTVYYDDAKILADQPDIYYVYSGGGQNYRFSSEEILHFKSSNTLDGILGISVKDQLKSTIGGGVKSQKMLNKMYDSGFTAKAVLNYTGSLNDANVEELVRMTEAYAKGDLKDKGVENIIPIPLGFSLNPLNVKLADNQFVEVRQYTALQIASAFGIKPYQIGDYTKSSYASAEAQQLSFLVDTLLYIIKQYEEELSYKLLSREEIDNGYHFKFNVAVILRADLATQINTLSAGVSNFIYTPNEARAMLDLEAKEGGDRLLGNGASIPVDMAGTQYTTDATSVNEEGTENDSKGKEEVDDGQRETD
jgi:HK97 family phage portal protein